MKNYFKLLAALALVGGLAACDKPEAGNPDENKPETPENPKNPENPGEQGEQGEQGAVYEFPDGFKLEYTADNLSYDSESACLSNDYVKDWGELKLVGNVLCTENGRPVQLRGWTTHGQQWSCIHCYDDEVDFKAMKASGANAVRLSMYAYGTEPTYQAWIKNCIDFTARLGMYAIVDWVCNTPGNPKEHLHYAPETFFGDIAEYVNSKDYHHVLYEICGDPNYDPAEYSADSLWNATKDYASIVLPEIEKKNPDAVVIIGTPKNNDTAFGFHLECPYKNPITYKNLNIMYSFTPNVGDKETAGEEAASWLEYLASYIPKLPIFVTEWRTTDSYNYNFSEDNSNSFLAVCNGGNTKKIKLSWCNWSWSDEGRDSGALIMSGNYSDPKSYSTSGRYIISQLRKGNTAIQ